jgi:hypothetical protein
VPWRTTVYTGGRSRVIRLPIIETHDMDIITASSAKRNGADLFFAEALKADRTVRCIQRSPVRKHEM